MKYLIIWETREYKEKVVEAENFDEAQEIWAEENSSENDYLVSIEDEKGMRLEYGYQEVNHGKVL